MGIPLSMYTLVQGLGRVDRNPSVGIGDNQYKVHMSFMCLVLLYIKIMQQNNKREQTISMVAMHEVLKFLVLPCKCQHVLMEQYFEDPWTTCSKRSLCKFLFVLQDGQP